MPYYAGATHFDGATWLINPSLTAINSKYLSYSMWLRIAANTNDYRVLAATAPEDGYNNWIFLNGPDQVFGAEVAADSLTAGVETSSGQPYPLDAWFHILGSYDTSIGTTGQCQLYIDNVAWDFGPPSMEVQGDPGTVPIQHWTGLPLWIGADSFDPDQFVGDVADFRLMPGTNLLVAGDIPLATRRLFIDANGKPVDPAVATEALGPPAVLLSGGASTFPINRGTGGAFTVTGTLTNAETSPSGPILFPPTVRTFPMATQTKTTSGQTTTYVITDAEGATITVALTQTYGAGNTATIATSGNVHQDGLQMLVTLMQLLSTGLVP